ncbi:MAG: hypothetical protein HZC10_06865 [Nitrospirae bacterium]|nr:hypothetical protein [Nitrospirota bacterium]
MWSDPKVWIPIIGVVLTVTVTFTIHYLGNPEFRGKAKRGLAWLRVRVLRQYIFYIFVILLIGALILFYSYNLFTLSAVFITYSIWITALAAYLRVKRKNISTIVSCRLGDENSERGENGLVYLRHEDGDAVKEIFNGELIRRTNGLRYQYYIYFAFRDDVVKYFRHAKTVIVLVEFFDFAAEAYKGHTFSIQYDSSDNSHPNPIFKTPNIANVLVSNSWQLGLFEIKDGRFCRRQQGMADFRIKNSPIKAGSSENYPDLYVRRVIAVALNE